MPVKKTTKKKTAKKPVKKAAPKKPAKAAAKKVVKKAAAKKPVAKPVDAYECGVCGFRVIVDETCGCVEEHVLMCCNKVMDTKKKR